MSVQIVYVTTKDEKEARFLAKKAINQKLAVCANLLGHIDSIYSWNGNISEEKEFALILKCAKSASKKLINVLKNEHSFENPCIVALPIQDGSEDFISWIKNSI